jgi:hypothetical protein
MHKAICAAFMAMALLLPTGAARAADAATCDAYVKEAVAKSQAVRQLGCGYEPNDPRWAAGQTGHARWCKSASKEAVVTETAHRRGQFKLCQLCRSYADLATAAAADNANAKCGFSGARWSARAEDHFGRCTATRNTDDAAKAIAAGSYAALTATMAQSLGLETGERTLGIAKCKLRPTPARRPART